MRSDIGVYGLGVMGENLSLNMEGRGRRVSVYNYETETVQNFMENRGKRKAFVPCYEEKEFVESLNSPRIIFVMIQAGPPVGKLGIRYVGCGVAFPCCAPGPKPMGGIHGRAVGNSSSRHVCGSGLLRRLPL